MEHRNNSSSETCVTMPWFECRPGIYEIDEFDCASIFVVVGEERALLIDTGTGIGDLKWLVENRITDKPYDVVMTHNHGDHIGGAGWFDKIWIHPADGEWNSGSTSPTVEFRKDYARLIRNREGKHYAYDPERDIRPWPAQPEIIPLKDGHVFDLGGRRVMAYHCPGHTAGEMVFIDDKTHTLLCGDACNCNWLLNTDLAPSMKECLEIALNGLRRIAEKCGIEYDADSVFNFHHDFRGFGQALNPDVLPNLIHCMESLIDKTAIFREIPDPLSHCGGMKTVAEYQNVQVSCMQGNIANIF